MASARIQRWSLTLSGYDYTIRYIKQDLKMPMQTCSADSLYLKPHCSPIIRGNHTAIGEFHGIPNQVWQIRTATARDPMLSRVTAQMVSSGWNQKDDSITLSFQRKQNELSIHDGCLLWGNREVVPQVLWQQVFVNFMRAILVFQDWRALQEGLCGGWKWIQRLKAT